jgi:hypothetical protein
MSWETLRDITREAAEYARAASTAPPTACPQDGEPLRSGPRGELYCPYDAYRVS